VYDGGGEERFCEMCEEAIRYVHVMEHPEWPERVEVGRYCARSMKRQYVPAREVMMVGGNTITVTSPKHGRRVFLLARLQPYRRRDGTETTLKVWQGRCVVCGGPFEVATPSQNVTWSNSFLLTTCQVHRGKPLFQCRGAKEKSNEHDEVRPAQR
jgi:hypothetical protein